MGKRAFLFPGQGAQTVGMGKDLYDHFSVARELFEQAEEVLQHRLTQVMFEGPTEKLTETSQSQVALFVHSMAMLAVLQEQMPNLVPDVCAGLSLGEYTALCASKRICFEDALKLVQWRGQVMHEACEAQKGTMACVMGLAPEVVEEMVAPIEGLWAANFNCPGQVVISGTLKGVERGAAIAKEAGAKRVLPLQVHGAFHSGLMAPAEERLAPKIEEAILEESEIRLVMNVPGDFAKEEEIQQNLIRQVTNPVRWQQGIEAMGESGVSEWIEIGCGKTLAGMNKRIGVGSTLSVGGVQDLDRLAEGVA